MTMQQSYLEVTFRHGRPLAAYLYLPREAGQTSHHTRRADHGLVVDFDANDTPIGIEITAPMAVSPAALNSVLSELGVDPIAPEELAPLRAA